MNPILLDFGPISIYWYSIIILIAILIASYVFFSKAKKQNYDEKFYTNLIFYGIIFGIIGARLYYVIFNLDYYLSNPFQIIAVWNGGLAIHGGIITGLIWFIYYSKKNKKNIFKVLDMAAPALIIGQAIGRWGNFFNSEAHGTAVTKEYLESLNIPDFIINGMYIGGNYYHPTFLYESFFDLIGFIILIVLSRKKRIKNGQIFGTYLIYYSILRFIIESLRTDSLMIGNIKVAELISIFLFILGILVMIYNLDIDKVKKAKKKIKKLIKKILRRIFKWVKYMIVQ